jgi:hypothetical protein
MTTITAPRPVATPFARIWNVTRLDVANPATLLVLPWVFLIAILLMNIAIWGLITYAAGDELAPDAFQWSGAASFIFIYLGIGAIQMMSVTFPFALGYGVTRRDFYLGSSLSFVLLSLLYGVGMTVLAAIERATGGWWLDGRMFTAVYFAGNEPWYVQFWVFFCGLLLSFFLGSVFAAVWVRWRAIGLVTTFIVLGFAIIGLIAVLTLGDLWGAFGQFVVDLGFAGAATASLVLSVVLAVLGFGLLRRATPRA